MKTALLEIVASLSAVAFVSAVVYKSKPVTDDPRIIHHLPAVEVPTVAPAPAAEPRQGGFVATVSYGSADVIGQTFPVAPVAPLGGGEVEAWQGTLTYSGGSITIRFGAWVPGGEWGAGSTQMRQWSITGPPGFAGAWFPTYPYGMPGAATFSISVPDATVPTGWRMVSWGGFAVR